jgi:hypothetical protein
MFRKTNNGAMQKARSTWWPAGSDLTLFSTRPMNQWEWFVFPRSGHPGGISRFRGAFALTTELVAGGVLGACNPKALRYTMSPTTLASPGVDSQLHGCEGASAWMRVGVWAHRGYLRSPVVQTTQAKSPPAFFGRRARRRPARGRRPIRVVKPCLRRLPHPTLCPSCSPADLWIRRSVGRAVLATREANQGGRTRLGFWAR